MAEETVPSGAPHRITVTAGPDAGVPDHEVVLADGRAMAVDSRGAEPGQPVVFLHAAPGSRRFDPDPEVTVAEHVRLVTIDRPGYGRSSPVPVGTMPTVASIADDVAAAIHSVVGGPVPFVGWSAGGRIALGVAARHPDLVSRVVLVGTPAPDDIVPWVPDEYRPMLAVLRRDPDHAVGLLAEALAPMAADIHAAVASIAAGPADEAIAASPARRARLEQMLAEAFRQGTIGTAIDIVADQVAPWGFEAADVQAPVTAVYGSADVIVTPAHGEYWARAVPTGELLIAEGSGHLLPMRQWEWVLDMALSA
jgi:pimeloyl-ACP methyl ester carboxylesterase